MTSTGPGAPPPPPPPPPPRPSPRRPGAGRAALDFVAGLVAVMVRAVRRLREWNRRDGAGVSGLAQLVEVHVLQTAGDATVAVALAGSLFFSVPTHEARSRVALYLVVTMAPFTLIAPVLGPLLDRFRHGRRIALAVTMVARAVLAIVIGNSLNGSVDALTLYPAALGVLVAGKAYTVARAAAVPRLVPEEMTLVGANARLTVAGIVTPIVAGGFAIAVRKTLGAPDELLLGAAVYVLGAFFAVRLPRTADGGDDPAATGSERRSPGRRRLRLDFPPEVRRALTAAASLRWLSGFSLFYAAFVVREHALSGLSGNVALVVLGAGILGGNFLGTTSGARITSLRSPRVSIGLIGVTAAVCVLAAAHWALLTALLLSLVGAATAAMTKLSLDSTIQERVDDAVRTSTFGRSETAMQLSWVIGGVVGILLPTNPAVGFAVASAVVLGSLLLGLAGQRRRAPVTA